MSGPLSGVRVVDLSIVVSGPMATAYLADQGADVIKVEMPEGDFTRYLGPAKGDVSALFLAVNRHKRSIALDLKKHEDGRVLRDLIASADVLVENFRPGAFARLGFGYDELEKLNPRLIMCSISGFGEEGPYAPVRVYDPLIQGVSGIACAQTNPATGEPELVRGLVCDKVAALTAAQAITAALFEREKSGRGQKVDLAMLDAAVSFLWPEGMYNHTFADDPPPPAPDLGAFYRLWKSKDGYVAALAIQDAEFGALCDALELDEMKQDPRFATIASRLANAVDLMQGIGDALARHDSATLMRRFAEHDACGAPVNVRADLGADPQVAHNETIAEFEHGNEGRVRVAHHPARFRRTPARAPSPAPHLGEHDEEIRREAGRDNTQGETSWPMRANSTS